MTIHVYGKKNCGLCKSAMKKVEVLLDRWGVADQHKIAFMDLETEFGAAEGDFFDVFHIPTVMVMRDEWRVLGRWEGASPPSEELEALLCEEEEAAAA